MVDDKYLESGGNGSNWPAYGRTASEQRYSPLAQVNDGNVKQLGIQWVLDLPNERSLTATPLAVDGVIYFTASYSRTRAVDARPGKVLWEFEPKVIEHAGDRMRIMWDMNRGPAFYKGKVIISAVDGRLIALDADIGEYKWHYQTNPGETWDYNSNMDIVLADVKYGGETIKALLHAPKNGFFDVINRKNGELLSAGKFGKVTWAERIDLKTGRPVEVEGARYENGDATVGPGPFGAHSWHAMSYNPNTGLVYTPTLEMAGVYKDKGMDLAAWQSPHFRIDPGVVFRGEDTPKDDSTVQLFARDPIKQHKVWQRPLPPNWNTGTMTTKGNLVFEGNADGEFAAFDATSGAKLWAVNVGLGISSPPITYTIDGKQYVSLLVGWGGGGTLLGSLAAQHGWKYQVHPRRLFTFSLDGKVPMPPPPAFAQPVDPPDFKIDSALAGHGGGAVSGGPTPDLRESPLAASHAALKEVLVNGARLANGMPKFAEYTDEDVDGLMHYICQRARESNAAQAATAKQ